MKSRLSSTIWTLISGKRLAFAVAIWLAFSAGKQAGSGSLTTYHGGGHDRGRPSPSAITVILLWRLDARS